MVLASLVEGSHDIPPTPMDLNVVMQMCRVNDSGVSNAVISFKNKMYRVNEVTGSATLSKCPTEIW